MRKIILNLAVSLDGYIEGKKGEIDWCLTDQDYGMKNFISSIDTMLMGRKSYELFSNDMKEFFPNTEQIVFSKTLKNEKIKIIDSDILSNINKMKKSGGKNIWLFGGAKLIKSMIDLKLVDEINILIHPLILGGGTPLFIPSNKRIKLELISSKSYTSGGIQTKYKILY